MRSTRLQPRQGGAKPAERDAMTSDTFAQSALLLHVLAQVNSLMSQEKSFELFCSEVGKILKEKLSFRFIHIWVLRNKDDAELTLVTPETHTSFRNMPVTRGIVGKAFREGRTVIAPDVHQDPDYINMYPETKSEIAIPLISEGSAIGVINIETDTYQTFEGQIPVLEVIAENLSHTLKVALLYKTEEQFRRLIEHMSEGVWVGDKNEQTLYTNPALQRMTGYTEKESLGMRSFDFFEAKNHERIKEENAKRTRGESGDYEATLVAKGGMHIPVIIHAVPFGEGGTMATMTDVHEIKEADEKLRDRFEKMQEAYVEMGRQGRRLDYLIEMTDMAIATTASVKQIANFLVNAFIMITKIDAATFRLFDEKTKKMVLVAQSGLGKEWWGKKIVPYHGSITEIAVLQGHAVKILDIVSDPRYTSRSLARKYNLKSALVVPLMVRDALIGSLTLYLAREGNISLLDDEFTNTFAKQAAIAIHLAEKGEK